MTDATGETHLAVSRKLNLRARSVAPVSNRGISKSPDFKPEKLKSAVTLGHAETHTAYGSESRSASSVAVQTQLFQELSD